MLKSNIGGYTPKEMGSSRRNIHQQQGVGFSGFLQNHSKQIEELDEPDDEREHADLQINAHQKPFQAA